MEFIHYLKKSQDRFNSTLQKYRTRQKQQQELANEIDRILQEIKSNIPLVLKYRERLTQPLLYSIGEVTHMVAQIPGPVGIDLELWEKEPLLKALFVKSDDVSQWLKNCINLQHAFEQTQVDELFGLLITDIQEKIYFGIESHEGNLQKDVRKDAVYFENPQLWVLSPDLETSRKEFQHHIHVLLFKNELAEIQNLTSLKKELKEQQDLLKFKLDGNKIPSSREMIYKNGENIDESKKILNMINQEIKKIGDDPAAPENHLSNIIQALMEIHQHIHIKRLSLRFDHMGIPVKNTSIEAEGDIIIAEWIFKGFPKRAAVWIRIKRISMNI